MEENPIIQTVKTGFVERAKAMIVSPKLEWPEIANETTEPAKVLTGYAIPLIAIGPIASLIGGQLFRPSFAGISLQVSFTTAVTTAVISFVLGIVGLFVIAFVANALSPKFGGRDNFHAAFRLVAYSMTAVWAAAIFGLIPALSILSIVGLYSLYVFAVGAKPILGVPEDKAVAYTAVTVVIAIVVTVVLASIAVRIA